MRELRRIDGVLQWAVPWAEEQVDIEEYRKQFFTKPEKIDREEKAAKRIQARKEYYEGQPREVSGREIWEEQIGEAIPRDAFVNQVTRRREQKEQSEAIADRLERCDIPARTGRDITVVDLITGEEDKPTEFINSNFIPVQQSRNIHQMFKHVQHYCETAKPDTLHMLVISGGWVPLADYRKEHGLHTRRMSKFHDRIKNKFGIEMGYYNIENTIQRSDDGIAMLHMHSHALIEVKQKLPLDEWKSFLKFSRNYFPKGYVHHSKIKDAKEVVKYVFKPSEFNFLNDNEFTELFYQIRGRTKAETGDEKDQKSLRFFIPLGRLRSFRSSLKKQKRKLIKFKNNKGKYEWRTTEIRERSGEETSSVGRTENIVVAITDPMPMFSPKRRPCLVVHGWNGDFPDLIKSNNLEELRARATAIYNSKNSADKSDTSFMKHTTTTTVQGLDRQSKQNLASVSQICADARPPDRFHPENALNPTQNYKEITK